MHDSPSTYNVPSTLPAISVVIPCFNHGQYVEEAIDSVLASDFQDFEIIVINDGSTDAFTNSLLKRLKKPRTRVIHQENQGLAQTRNNGIAVSKGKYFLPLDADDKIHKTYLRKAYEILEADHGLGFVFSDYANFGMHDTVWRQPEYSFYRTLWENQVTGCALTRKAAWHEVHGYNPNMIYGYEDWDFWVNLGKHGWHGRRISDVLFYYRRADESMVSRARLHRKWLVKRLRENHLDIYSDLFRIRSIRREWGAKLVVTRGLIALKNIARSAVFPPSARMYLRKTWSGKQMR